MSLHELLDTILSEARDSLTEVKEPDFQNLSEALAEADRVFVCGGGRSGLVVRAFAMRLMHLGFVAHVVGEATTPSIRTGDLLLACSASGTTETTLTMAKRAQAAGADIAAVTSAPQSPLAQMAGVIVHIPSPTKHDQRSASRQFGSTLFEQAALLFLDAVCLALQRERSEDPRRMMSRHSNLE